MADALTPLEERLPFGKFLVNTALLLGILAWDVYCVRYIFQVAASVRD